MPFYVNKITLISLLKLPFCVDWNIALLSCTLVLGRHGFFDTLDRTKSSPMGEAFFLAILGEPRPTRLPKVVIKRLPQMLGDPGIQILAKKSGAY